MTAVQVVEVEAALQRVARGEGNHNDANLLRSIFQMLVNEVRVLRGSPLAPLDKGGACADRVQLESE